MNKSITDIYNNLYRTKTDESLLSEEVDVTMSYPDGKTETFKLEDGYGRVLAKQLRVNNSGNVDTAINAIFINSEWTGNQEGPKNVFKDIIIKTDYNDSVELVEFLSQNKDTLLKRQDFPTAQVVNFVDAIKSKLPDKFKAGDIDTFIKQVHLKVVPKAATGVGLGEGTFSIFGTAQKGNSGDLQWDGSEVEIKTNGPNKGSGAILGGDGTINKVTDRIEAKSDYENINQTVLKQYRDQLVDIGTTHQDGAAGAAQAKYDAFRKDSSKLKNLFNNPSFNAVLDVTDSVDEFINKQLTRGSFKVLSKPKPNSAPEDRLLNRLITRIDHGITKLTNQGTNLPGQMASFFGPEATKEDYIKVFSEFKTYADASDITDQVTTFFNQYDYTNFSPRSNYDNFQRLVGAISLVCYKEKLGFDFITAGNDDKMTTVMFDMRNSSITNIYKQLDQVPNVSFDLQIDVYVDGSYKSQTVIAKSPRIKLN
tara:strand:- start:136 stop:1575 length:1440 start_codon:yes stop_codon:yes gene_type:complete